MPTHSLSLTHIPSQHPQTPTYSLARSLSHPHTDTFTNLQSHTHTHTHTRSLSLTHTHAHAHSHLEPTGIETLSPALTPTHIHTQAQPFPLALTHTHSHTHSPTPSLIHIQLEKRGIEAWALDVLGWGFTGLSFFFFLPLFFWGLTGDPKNRGRFSNGV